MKCYTQVYVMDSLEAVDTYCRAFGAQVSFEIKNEAKTEYEHCELSVNGEPILAVSEAPEPYDVGAIHKMKWQTMTFNAFEVLKEGGVVLEDIGALPWSKCCATVMDKYGVCWWVAI